MSQNPALTASEVGALWMCYQQNSMVLRFIDHFIENAENEEAKELMQSFHNEINPFLERIKVAFQEEGRAVPIGFTEVDVKKGVPVLFENNFDIMFLRIINEISSAMSALNLTMAYRSDIRRYLIDLTALTQKYYDEATNYLLSKGILPRAPFVPAAMQAQFVQDEKYLGGINPFSEKRPLNTVEIAHLYRAVEANTVGRHMINGFEQCAEKEDVKKYMHEGSKLGKKIIKELTAKLLESNITVPSPSGGNVTRSEVAPFSDKAMMYCVSMFCNFSLGGNSLGTAFSLRSDLSALMTWILKDVFQYAEEGAKLMIKHGWLEQPPES